MIRDPSWEEFLIIPGTIFTMQTALFFVAWAIKDNSIVDIFWSMGMAVPNLVILIYNGNWHHRTIISLALVWVWALRLFLHILVRHNGEDWRYQNFRKNWRALGGYCAEVVLSYVIVFLLQGFFMTIVGGAAFFTALFSSEDDDLFVLEFVGGAVLLFGLIFETIADMQLSYHIKKPENKGKIIKTGLWRYSRHPNYFGEVVVWWGVYLIACSIKWGWVTFYSALAITLLIRFVSGVPFLEKKYQDRPDFIEYKKETNCFVPWFVTKVKSNAKIDSESQQEEKEATVN